MKIFIPLFLIISLLSSCQSTTEQPPASEEKPQTEISFITVDSIEIIGDLYVTGKENNTILLFHQGGSNARGEYRTIIPRLIDNGYNVLAIDQRVGGQYYGSYNRTLANIPTNVFGDGYDYCDAYTNLEAALDFIISSEFTGKKILWGSSYSASLAIQLANNRQEDVNAVLAFSPASGGSMKDCLPDTYFETLSLPLLILRPPSEMENENTKTQLNLAEEFNHKTYVAQHGVHGSSMLVKERVGHDVENTWEVVLTFLKEI